MCGSERGMWLRIRAYARATDPGVARILLEKGMTLSPQAPGRRWANVITTGC
jgi:hypothetical protein